MADNLEFDISSAEWRKGVRQISI